MQVLQWILGVSPCVKLVQKREVFQHWKGDKNVFGLELCQNRQLYDTSKQFFIFLFLPSNICVLSIPFFIHIGEKRLGTPEDTRDPPPPKEGEVTKNQAEDEEGNVLKVGEIVTTTGDLDVEEEESHFTSDSAQILIGATMGCKRDLENIKHNINDVQQKIKKIIDGLGRI
ncbi:hypothetical protein AB205_0072030 [Aquarana catesbeiana]|uniref:Uncharacterized protein n=1 Tax=Aquarana catesbeiana TaxID=8400 RepID=A0A2G9SB43_AQUCT|nr:hypothetical protein AB205_0072030 [Aquarana catesbeiana]